MKFSTTIVLAILAATTLAAPTAVVPGPASSNVEPYVAPNTDAVLETRDATLAKRWVKETCDVHDHFLWRSFSIYIGYVYADGSGCNGIFHQLQQFWISDWQCADAGDGNTRLWFNAPPWDQSTRAGRINDVLKSIYPQVEAFTCPNN